LGQKSKTSFTSTPAQLHPEYDAAALEDAMKNQQEAAEKTRSSLWAPARQSGACLIDLYKKGGPMPINPMDSPSHVLPEAVQTACDSQFSDLARVRRLRQVSEYHPSRLKLLVRVYNGKATL
jgi:hypothetical protein